MKSILSRTILSFAVVALSALSAQANAEMDRSENLPGAYAGQLTWFNENSSDTCGVSWEISQDAGLKAKLSNSSETAIKRTLRLHDATGRSFDIQSLDFSQILSLKAKKHSLVKFENKIYQNTRIQDKNEKYYGEVRASYEVTLNTEKNNLEIKVQALFVRGSEVYSLTDPKTLLTCK